LAKKKKCVGCGIELQKENPEKQGYIPKNVLESGKDIHCQRCFKIKNYGEYLPVELKKEDYRREVGNAAEKADAVIAVFDIIDFEGSFDDEILDILREKNSIIAINKLDLIPDKKHPSEVSDWVKARLAEEGIVPLDIAIVSAKSGYGVNGIIRKLKHFYPERPSIVILGTTNVGKSSIINGLLGNKKITTSKYPGTTLKNIENMIPETNITIIDTPGLIPEGRVSDMVCQECNLKIVPSNEISRKTFKLDQDRILMFGGLLWIKILNSEKSIFSAFASKDVSFHETNEGRINDLLKDHSGDKITPPCEDCRDEYSSLPMRKEEWTIETGEELVFKGLGWISVKRGPLVVEATLPEGAEIILRDAFIKPKRK
jgi:ribosome biogenesis GTPase YqeH